MTTNTIQERSRAEFEAYCRSIGLDERDLAHEVFAGDEYASSEINARWLAWQMARRSLPVDAVEFEALDKLEALARAATPGPWALEDNDAGEAAAPFFFVHKPGPNGVPDDGMRVKVEKHHMYPARKPVIGSRPWENLAECALANAEFIAAANPAAILGLIALARAGLAAMGGQEEAPSGYKLMPLELTVEMASAAWGREALEQAPGATYVDEEAKAIYARLLAASPTPQRETPSAEQIATWRTMRGHVVTDAINGSDIMLPGRYANDMLALFDVSLSRLPDEDGEDAAATPEQSDTMKGQA